jgi:hypothetical protein
MITPFPSQLEAVDWFFNDAKQKGIIADEMGLGKTGAVYLAWKRAGFPKPCLLIAGRNAQVAWLNQAADFGCPKPILIRGKSAAERKELWDKYGDGFVSVTRESLKRDVKIGNVNPYKWKAVIDDEVHKDANRKTQNYETLKMVCRNAAFICFTSGSIARRGPQSLYGPLSIVRPQQYKSYWKFVNTYCLTEQGPYGLEIVGTKNEAQLQRELATIVLRRTKAEARPGMPPKIRDVDSNVLEMSPSQKLMYNEMVRESIYELKDGSGDVVTSASILAKMQRLRQILLTPKLLDPSAEYGAAIDRCVEMLEDADDQHMAIFTPFASAIPIIKSRLLEEKYDARRIICLRGGLQTDQLSEAIAHFKAVRGIAICSIKYAESFDLIPASWGVFVGFEWDAWDNMQAEDRLHRGEIERTVNLYYLRHQDGIDTELILPALDTKTANVMAVLKDLNKVRQLLKLAK